MSADKYFEPTLGELFRMLGWMLLASLSYYPSVPLNNIGDWLWRLSDQCSQRKDAIKRQVNNRAVTPNRRHHA